MKKNHQGTIKEIKKVNNDVYKVVISAPSINALTSGEYISILCDNLTFRRPFSIAHFKDNNITILIKKRGKGTDYLSSLNVGDEIEFSAPLGNTFNIENKKTLLVGAGIGIAPLFYLQKQLKSIGAETCLAAGFLNSESIIEPIETNYDFVSTDDGSNGNQGSICNFLDKLFGEFNPEKIVSCAPEPVLRFISEFALKKGIECEVAMEKVMACGIGVCRGCAIKVKKEGKIINKTVCKDGPVFNGAEVVW